MVLLCWLSANAMDERFTAKRQRWVWIETPLDATVACARVRPFYFVSHFEEARHIDADPFLYPLAAFGHRICNLSSVDLVFCYELEQREHIASMAHLQASSKSQLTHADLHFRWELGVCHLMDLCISHTISSRCLMPSMILQQDVAKAFILFSILIVSRTHIHIGAPSHR